MSVSKRVAVLAGDGIGPEIMRELHQIVAPAIKIRHI